MTKHELPASSKSLVTGPRGCREGSHPQPFYNTASLPHPPTSQPAKHRGASKKTLPPLVPTPGWPINGSLIRFPYPTPLMQSRT